MYEIDKKRFGAFVASLRKEKGLTQRELAEKLFLSDKAVSKWETGVSIPDTALLVPLAELLGVTVTELLLCGRVEEDAPLAAGQVEDVVKTALGYTREKPPQTWQTRSPWPLAWLAALALGGGAAWGSDRLGLLTEAAATALVLGAVFGAYFCILAPVRLPAFYDERPWGLYVDGPVRMNVPGVHFNNRNWPYILRALRLWSCLTTAIVPAASLALGLWLGELWQRWEGPALLMALLGGLFAPVYILGRK